MSDEEQLQRLLVFASSEDRICPQPGKWDAIWRLLGQPRGDLEPPLILSGWAFSTDREKRERFSEHLRFARSKGRLYEVDRFVRSLKEDDWHTCDAAHLDRSYGDAIRQDQERRSRAVNRVRDIIASVADIENNGSAFARENLAELIFLFYLMLDPDDLLRRLEQTLSDNARIASAVEDAEWSLLDGVAPGVSDELRKIINARKAEAVFLEILAAIHESRLPLDRDVVEEIVSEAFYARDS
ncbi:hypothetical protein DLM45_07490 [Hyphomicrobium methylovorum]|uniref:hypothetical protein n=1 Tax=Hyphomicrobium methylovorum TaxID=84 RepID=UPI0015E7E32E|nr:hypothetical protein [Hyphomicrobium methylovorum]MBA2126065.1 hypothetical protein [Hyphomicrobium methylovorum]